MSDDFNTPVVIAIIFDIFRFVNANRDKLSSEKASKIELLLDEIFNVLGFEKIEKKEEIVDY